MKRILPFTLLLVFLISSTLIAQDTLVVQTFTWDGHFVSDSIFERVCILSQVLASIIEGDFNLPDNR